MQHSYINIVSHGFLPDCKNFSQLRIKPSVTLVLRWAFLPFLLLLATALAAQGSWSDAASWPAGRVPQSGEEVVIPEGTTIVLDVNPPPLGGIRIEGELSFADRDLELTAAWILVSGRFTIGTEAQPYTRNASILLNGPDEDVSGMGGRFLATWNGGSLELHGTSAGHRSWSQLNVHAFRGAEVLFLKDDPTGWRPGDELAIAPSGYDPYEAEAVTITGIEGRRVDFTPALKYTTGGNYRNTKGRPSTSGPRSGCSLATSLFRGRRAVVPNILARI